MQKLNFSKLRLLHDVACKHNDAHMADFIGETPCLLPVCKPPMSLSPLFPSGLKIKTLPGDFADTGSDLPKTPKVFLQNFDPPSSEEALRK